MLRSARLRAHLTQRQLAARAGLTQSVVSAYESGRRQPSVPTLAAMIAATGFELDLRLRATPRRLDRLRGPIGRRVRYQRRPLLDAADAHGVSNVRIFGSVARGEDRPDSDLDLLVDLPAGMGLIGLGRVRDEFEAIVGCRVDLVPVHRSEGRDTGTRRGRDGRAVSDRVDKRLADIADAITAIAAHLTRGDLSDGLMFDAVRIRLLEIGEVKALPTTVADAEPEIPWTQIARMRDHLAHRYFDTNHAIVQATVDHDLPELDDAVARLQAAP